MKHYVTKDIHKLQHLIFNKIEELAPPSGAKLNFTQIQILNFLYGKKDICQKDLEQELHLKKSSVSSSLDDLEKKGEILRIADQCDKRRNYVCLTEQAIQKHQELDAALAAINKQIEKGISSEELNCFFKVLDQMNKNLQEAER